MRPDRQPLERPLRLAVIGCGAAAEKCHLPGIVCSKDVELVALVDSVAGHARHALSLFQQLGGDIRRVRIASTPSEIANDTDAAIVSTPHVTHESLVIDLARQGIHSLVEKPMAPSAAACDSLFAGVRKYGTTLAVAFVRRLFPSAVWARTLIGSGRLGRVTHIVWSEGATYDWPLVSPSFFVPQLAAGGVLIDTGSHVLDLLMWWLDAESGECLSCQDTSKGGVEGEVRVQLAIADVDVRVELSRLRPLANTCNIVGELGCVEFGIDVDASYLWRDSLGIVQGTGNICATAPAEHRWEGLFGEQIRNFAAAVRGREPVYAGYADGRRVAALIDACYGRREERPMPWREMKW
jgi:predicted dehydrogenase